MTYFGTCTVGSTAFARGPDAVNGLLCNISRHFDGSDRGAGLAEVNSVGASTGLVVLVNWRGTHARTMLTYVI